MLNFKFVVCEVWSNLNYFPIIKLLIIITYCIHIIFVVGILNSVIHIQSGEHETINIYKWLNNVDRGSFD